MVDPLRVLRHPVIMGHKDDCEMGGAIEPLLHLEEFFSGVRIEVAVARRLASTWRSYQLPGQSPPLLFARESCEGW